MRRFETKFKTHVAVRKNRTASSQYTDERIRLLESDIDKAFEDSLKTKTFDSDFEIELDTLDTNGKTFYSGSPSGLRLPSTVRSRVTPSRDYVKSSFNRGSFRSDDITIELTQEVDE
jgi:hypothetical protein